ncbi:MAG TPA: secretion protein, partial [Cytophagales bacterium]|nr:secretion protein [Cytophagales bacterium]
MIANILAYGQFAPRAGQQGSTAIKSDSAVFKAWASSCTLHRGYMNMANPLAGRASAGNEKNAVGG